MESPNIEISLRKAEPPDLDAVFEVMADAANWLQSRGIDQWRWVLSHRGREYLLKRIESAETYLVYRGPHEKAIATFTVQWEDVETWGEAGGDGSAGYVHGLAVCRRVGGKGLGNELLQRASKMILDQGRRVVRLDCRAESEALCQYYRRAGFEDRGLGGGVNGFPAVQLFERLL
ncbi:MAG TPA: GNAT family N-acetyltransferase [Tepidisphaeraceae bacterium]|jgi:ribosomal protein S18 acetylase RimI-like enzyme